MWLTDEPAAVEQWVALWAMPVAELWTASEHVPVARLAAMYAAGGRPGTRNAIAQAQLERRLYLDPLSRRHAGIAVEGDLMPDASTAGPSATSAFAPSLEASSVVVWALDGTELEVFGQLTPAGQRALEDERRAS